MPMRISARSVPIEYYILRIAEPTAPEPGTDNIIIGYLADQPIFATVADSTGTCYRYVGLAARLSDGRYDVRSLSPGEWIVEPGLVYSSEG
ncbi:conserved hypothetical protein [Mesorhizobium plurifarium]|uniref:Uncharacterized protein n=1 Tax=Mesorhizobium plurifarium TaxID=69974 RepID=A0A0K2VMN6_MESPL|nr:conserved hypothetical protein [Mesorhizobium plurifarium]